MPILPAAYAESGRSMECCLTLENTFLNLSQALRHSFKWKEIENTIWNGHCNRFSDRELTHDRGI